MWVILSKNVVLVIPKRLFAYEHHHPSNGPEQPTSQEHNYVQITGKWREIYKNYIREGSRDSEPTPEAGGAK